jgi:hypothetical protein
VPDASGDRTFLTSEHQRTIEELFSSGLENYESDSMSTSGPDMGECDPSVAHPIVHRILIEPDPLVLRPGDRDRLSSETVIYSQDEAQAGYERRPDPAEQA